MGDAFEEGWSDELPVHSVCLSAFEMDIHEITNAEYAECVADGGCTAPRSSNSYSRATYYGDPAYDDYPVISVMQMEDLGFFAKGKAAEFLLQRDLTWQGDFPHNTSGGQLSAGQAGAAGGFIGLVEAVRQLTGQAGKRQVAGARLGLVSGFGMVNYDRGVCSGAAVLEGAV